MNNNEIKLNSTDKQEILKNYPISNSKKNQLWEIGTTSYEGIDIGNELSIGLIVSGTILALGAPITGSGAIVLGTMLPLFWPSNPESQWSSLIDYAGGLIDNKLNGYALSDAISKIEGLASVIKKYEDYRTKLLNGQVSKEVVFNKFYDADSLFDSTMSQLKKSSYEVTLLPAYALAANMHLLLMRDGLLYANEIGINKNNLLDEKTLYDNFLTAKKQYINHCLDFYNEGLEKFPKPVTKVADLKKVNDYKLYMTINVLDIISLFTIYDIKKYPGDKKNSTLLPKTDLTREVCTSPLNDDSKELNADYIKVDLESFLTPRPHFFSILKEFKAEIIGEEWKSVPSLNLGPDNRKDRPFISGTACNFSYINDDIIRKGTAQGAFGWYNDAKGIESITLDKETRIYEVKTTHFGDFNTMSVLQQINLYATVFGQEIGSYHITGGDTNRYLRSLTSKVSEKIKIPPNVSTFNNYSHNLSNMLSYNNSIKFQTSVFTWTHASVDRENLVKKDRITQIAAVKGIEDENQAKVIKGLGCTGGDLVNIDNDKTLSVKIKHEFKNTKYKIRLRYAARYNTPIDFTLGNSTFTVTVKSTFDNEHPLNLKPEYFDYVDIAETLYENQQLEDLCKVLCKGYNIIIDKIEFIPESIASKL